MGRRKKTEPIVIVDDPLKAALDEEAAAIEEELDAAERELDTIEHASPSVGELEEAGEDEADEEGDEDEAHEAERVRKLHRRPPPEPTRREARWFIPRAYGDLHAHAYIVLKPPPATSSPSEAPVRRSLCLGVIVDGGIYPPPEDVPHCHACEEALARLRKEAADADGE